MSAILTMYVVYDHPLDFPDEFVVREWNSKLASVTAGKLVAHDASYEEVIKSIRSDFTNIGRQPDDDPAIKEVWL